MGNCPRITHHLLGYQYRQEQWAPSLYCEQLESQLDHYIVHLFQDRCFSLSRLATGHSPSISVQRGLVAPSSTLLVPSVSSPCSNANGGIGPLATGSSDWLTLQMPQTNQTWKGESTEV